MRTIAIFLSMIFVFNSMADAEFEQTSRRYASNQDIYQYLSRYLPNYCTQILDEDRSVLGFDSVATGSSISPTPSAMTILKITTCIRGSYAQFVSAPYGIASVGSGDELFGGSRPELYQILLTDQKALWSKQSPQFKQSLIANMVMDILGPDAEIKDFGLIPNVDDFRTSLMAEIDKNPNISLYEALESLTINLMTRDEFLSY